MYLARWSTLLLAAVLSAPALWLAFVKDELDYAEAGIRYLIAVPVSAVMLALLRALAAGYKDKTTDEPSDAEDDQDGPKKNRRIEDSEPGK